LNEPPTVATNYDNLGIMFIANRFPAAGAQTEGIRRAKLRHQTKMKAF